MKTKMIVLSIVVATLMLSSCGSAEPEIQNFTIGIVNPQPIMEPLIEAFKEGLKQSGYIEGVNVSYIYNGPTFMDPDVIKAEVQHMVDQEVDLLVAIATPVALAAKAITKGTNIPVIFTPITDPVKTGMAESLEAPGGNMTGLKTGGAAAEGTLEMFLQVAPDVGTIYVPHNTEEASAIGLANLQEEADSLGVELVLDSVSTVSEIEAAIASLPTDVDAVFLLQGKALTEYSAQWAEACNAANLPMITTDIVSVKNDGALMAYTPSFESMGKNTSAIAIQVLEGADPATVPVGSAEAVLYINLKTAQAIGLEISDEVLALASFIYR